VRYLSWKNSLLRYFLAAAALFIPYLGQNHAKCLGEAAKGAF
jgi:hypothetical protein